MSPEQKLLAKWRSRSRKRVPLGLSGGFRIASQR